MKWIVSLIPIFMLLSLALANEVTVTVNVVQPTLTPMQMAMKQMIGLTILAGVGLMFLKSIDSLSLERLIALVIAAVIGIAVVAIL